MTELPTIGLETFVYAVMIGIGVILFYIVMMTLHQIRWWWASRQMLWMLDILERMAKEEIERRGRQYPGAPTN